MKWVIKFIGIFFVLILMAGSFLYFNNDIGVSRLSIESEARKSQKIKDDWQVEKYITDTMSAMIFYPEDKSDHTFSIYVNRPGPSFGYFFRRGGHIISVEKYISEFTVEGYNVRALISMNTQEIEKVEIDNGNSIQTVDIDSSKPFVFVLPKNIGSVTFFDIYGDTVETMNN